MPRDEPSVWTFPTAEDFRNYADDHERQSFLHLKDSAVERVLLIEGVRLS